MSVEDYLDLAEQAKSKKKKLEYIDKALAMNPEDLDLLMLKLHLSKKDEIRYLQDLADLIKLGEMLLRKHKLFEESRGRFWLVLETRPYMRVRYAYTDALAQNGMMLAAVAECLDMLGLCPNDNLGIRYTLMHLYAYMQDENAALALFKEHGSEYDSQMFLPLAVMYFKLGNFKEAKKYVQQLAAVNKDTKKFLSTLVKDELYNFYEAINPYGYQVNCLEELAHDFLEFTYLFNSAPNFAAWAVKQVKR